MVKRTIVISFLVIGFLLPISFVSAGNISSSYKYAWSDQAGYVNFENVTVASSALSGYAWSANAGWINFSPAMGGVLNDGSGDLSGYAWGEGLGWIDFGDVSINPATGRFSGTASGTLIGTLTFDCANYCDVRTDWRAVCTSWTYSGWSACSGGQQTRTILSSSPSGCSGGSPVLSQSCSSGGGAQTYSPPAIGSGTIDKTVGINQSGDIGLITNAGVNYLSYINSDAGFQVVASKNQSLATYHFLINDLDLFSKTIRLSIKSLPAAITLKLGQSAKVDLDNDKIDDLEIKFVNIWVNRAELTIKSLFVARENKVGPQPNIPAINVPAAKTPASKPAAAKYIFKRNLTTNMVGDDVKELQKYLNANGFILAKSGPGSPGKETNKFGRATRLALIKFQKAKKINPAVGYFGPLTRVVVNGKK